MGFVQMPAPGGGQVYVRPGSILAIESMPVMAATEPTAILHLTSGHEVTVLVVTDGASYDQALSRVAERLGDWE